MESKFIRHSKKHYVQWLFEIFLIEHYKKMQRKPSFAQVFAIMLFCEFFLIAF